jgi:hypothetical protein
MVFIYIFEDGTIKQTPVAPPQYDLEYVSDGILQILKVDNGVVYETNGNMWTAVALVNPT